MNIQRFAWALLGKPTSFDDVWRETQQLKQALESSSDYSQQNYLTTEPEKTFAGMLVLADGVIWNPGSGEGAYRRNLANNAWVHLG